MGVMDPRLPEFDLAQWRRRPYHERVRMMCLHWAEHGFGSPPGAYGFYVLKLLLYVGGWMAFVAATPGLGGLGDIGSWWSEPIAFQKAVVWTLLFEMTGLGGASGPLTARFLPPIGGALYWLRPGTTRLPPWPRIPLTAGHRRGLVDVVLYLAIIVLGVRAMLAAELTAEVVLPIVALLPLLGLRDKTIFLAARAEVHWVFLIVFCFPAEVIPGSQVVQIAIWWGAASSKLNHHFAGVITVMISNSPIMRSRRLKRAMYRDFPDDLRASRLAGAIGHGGTAIEYAFPVILLLGQGGWLTTVGLVVMASFHLFILLSIPMGVPLEWNVFTIYAGLFLFGANAQVTPLELGSSALIALLVAGVLLGPVLGNLRPGDWSFLPSMRYYAGNWATSMWLFRDGCQTRLDERLTKSAPIVQRQLERLYDDELTRAAILGKAQAFRAMHLHGRALNELLPHAVDDLERYHVHDGEWIAGVVLGWNFGEGHLHHEQLLAAVQQQCGFEEGELRVIYVESQPLHRASHDWRILDAATGLVEEGRIRVADLLETQPWPSRSGSPESDA